MQQRFEEFKNKPKDIPPKKMLTEEEKKILTYEQAVINRFDISNNTLGEIADSLKEISRYTIYIPYMFWIPFVVGLIFFVMTITGSI